jgi:hypothetical protein
MNFPDTITIEVTEEDIKKGEPDNCVSCAIALAVRKMFPTCRVDVDEQIRLRENKQNPEWDAHYELPLEAKEFIMRFDARCEVKPFSFVSTKL